MVKDSLNSIVEFLILMIATFVFFVMGWGRDD